MRFDLTDLRVFLHACEGGSMTEAAERSHLTLAAVSARIGALEDRSGVTLLNRHRRGVSTTAAGALLARHAGVVFHQLAILQKDLDPSAAPLARPIVLLGNSSALCRPLAGLLTSLLDEHPSARITVRESGSEITVHALHMGAAEIGLISDASNTQGLTSIDLGPDPLCLIAPPGHPLAAPSSVHFHDVLTHEWIGWGEGSALHTHLAMRAFQAGKPICHKVTMPSADEVMALVARGLGISVLPVALVRPGSQQTIAVVPLADDWAHRRLLACWKPDLDNPVATSLATVIRKNWSPSHLGSCKNAGSPAPSHLPAPAPTTPHTN
jgi:DNA-binding transcriptional LysR family regulator